MTSSNQQFRELMNASSRFISKPFPLDGSPVICRTQTHPYAHRQTSRNRSLLASYDNRKKKIRLLATSPMRRPSPTAEEMLEGVQRLEDRSGTARTKVLGKRLNVTLGTVTNNLTRLQRLGLVKRERYRGAKLTAGGRRIAMDVLRRHRLLERLLTDILRVGWSRSHYAACKLEHCIDDDVADAIEAVVGHPKTCPHGNAIPTKSGMIARQQSMRLTELSAHDTGIMIRVLDEEEEGALGYLESMGLIPGADFAVEGCVPFDGAVKLTLGDSRVTVSKRAASLVVVKKRSQVKTDA